MEAIEAIRAHVAEYSDPLQPVRQAAIRYLAYPCAISNDGVMEIGHRPWVVPQNYMFALFPGIDEESLKFYSQRFKIAIPTSYSDVLRELNGAFVFGMFLCGIPGSMLGDPPLLDRAALKCQDLATASTVWGRRYYRGMSEHFHFGYRKFSYVENAGYFIDRRDQILCAKKDGSIVDVWSSFKDFLSHELRISEALEEQLHPSNWGASP
jgi:hypothetical protein